MAQVKSIRKKFRRINENVSIPPELANQYLAVRKQIADKQTRKDQIMKSVNQIDNEINILNKNILAIETRAAQMQGRQAQKDQQDQQQAEKGGGESPQKIELEVKESLTLDEAWKRYISEDMDSESIDLFADEIIDLEDYMVEPLEAEDDPEDDLDDNIEEPEDYEMMENDFVFAVRVDDMGDQLIAKFFKNEDDDFWRVRVVKGEEEPLESMRFDPDMEIPDIIEHLSTIYDEAEEIDMDEYEDLVDDKEEIDDLYYNDDSDSDMDSEDAGYDDILIDN